MANTYTALYYHIVFSTKNRTEYLNPEISPIERSSGYY